MKKYLLIALTLVITFAVTGCGNSNTSNSSTNIESNDNSTNKIKIDKVTVHNKYYELLNKEYKSYVWDVWIGTHKYYEEHNKYLSDFMEKYYVSFLDIDDDDIDELFLFEYKPSPETEKTIFSMENGRTSYNNYTKYAIDVITYSDNSNDSYNNVNNIKVLGSIVSNGPVKKSSNPLTSYSFYKDNLAFFHSISLLDAMDNYYQRSNKGGIMTRDYVESLSKEWSIYNNFYESIKIVDNKKQLYLSGNNNYAKVIDKELIEIGKSEFDSIVNSTIKVNFEKIDSTKINIDIEYPETD